MIRRPLQPGAGVLQRTPLLLRTLLVVLGLSVASLATAQDVDVTPPVLEDFTFTPTAVDVSAGSQTVAATLQVTDDLAGVSSVSVAFLSPSFGQFQSGQAFAPSAGTRLQGTYVVNVVIPHFAEGGTWTVASITLFDSAGNSTVILTAVLQSRGLPTALQVTSTPDTEGPHLMGLSISPAIIDASADDVLGTVDLQVTDNLSGVAFAACVPGTQNNYFFFAIILRSPSGAQERFIAAAGFALVAGTRADGTWRATFRMPRFSEPGAWTVQSLFIRDCAGNGRSYNTATLLNLGFPISFDVVSAPADTQPPVLASLSYLPITINTSTGFQVVAVRIGIRDDLAGADFSLTTPQLVLFERGVRFRSPSGNQVRQAAFGTPFTLVSGTPLDGIWEANVFFPQFSEDGTWRIDLLQIKDAVRNVSSFNTADLEAMGLPVTLEIIRPSLISDGTVGPDGGTVADDTFGDRATITFAPEALTTTTDVAIDVFLEPLDIPNPTGFSGPGTLFVNIQLTPEPDFPLSPPGMTIVLPMPNPMPAGTVLSLFRVDPVTGNLVEATDVFGMEATGTVASDGLSATFFGVASLSTVVGLIPEALSVAIDIKPGESPNAVNLGSGGVLPVAILSTESFDARTVRPETVRLAGAGPRLRANGRPMFSVEDVNGDGRPDMILNIETRDLELTSDSIEAVLQGETTGGMRVIGRDSIRIVP